MQRGLKTVDGEVGPLVLNALVSGRAMVLGTHTLQHDVLAPVPLQHRTHRQTGLTSTDDDRVMVL